MIFDHWLMLLLGFRNPDVGKCRPGEIIAIWDPSYIFRGYVPRKKGLNSVLYLELRQYKNGLNSVKNMIMEKGRQFKKKHVFHRRESIHIFP